MQSESNWHYWALLPSMAIGQAHAAPVEGELASNAAAVLVLLGVWALLMGMRNLRELRHKRLVLEREPQNRAVHDLENPDAKEHN